MVDHVYKVESQYLDEKAGVFPLSTGVKNLGSVTVIFLTVWVILQKSQCRMRGAVQLCTSADTPGVVLPVGKSTSVP
jgi:hypothetical protein